MPISELIKQITDEIKAEIQNEPNFDETLLEIKVKGAVRDVKTARKYPFSYSEALIEADLERYFSQIKAIARFDYNQIGAEGQTSYSADGESIHYVSRDNFFAGVLPISIKG